MEIKVEFWQLVGMAGGIIAAIVALIGWFILQLKDQFTESLENKFTAIQNNMTLIHKDSKEWARVERELMELKADLPMRFVMREDYVRNQTIIEAKLDAIALRQENRELRGRHEH